MRGSSPVLVCHRVSSKCPRCPISRLTHCTTALIAYRRSPSGHDPCRLPSHDHRRPYGPACVECRLQQSSPSLLSADDRAWLRLSTLGLQHEDHLQLWTPVCC